MPYVLYQLTSQGWSDRYAEHSPVYASIALANSAAHALERSGLTGPWLIKRRSDAPLSHAATT